MEPVRIVAHGVNADLHGIDAALLQDAETLRRLMATACDEAGLTMVSDPAVHKFTEGGAGVTGFVMLSESHLAFHTYPEHGLLLLDLLTCGTAEPEKAIHVYERELRPTHIERHQHRRTPVPGPRQDK